MKKSILIASLLCFSVALMAKEKEQEVKGAHPFKVEQNEKVAQEFSHWSLTPHVGFNVFDGDFNSEMKHPIGYPTAGLDIEYSFTPVWGLGVNYTFDWYKVAGKGGNNASTLLDGMMHRAGLYVSMDFMNLFFPRAKRKIFSMEAIVGGGYTWYKSDKLYYDSPSDEHPTWKRGNTASYINEDGENAPSYMTKYNGELFLQAGLNFEFNLNRTIALGVRGVYNYFVNDYIDGRGYAGPNAVASKNNDGIFDVTLNMRFKLMAVSKTHVRNISSIDTWKELEQNPIHDTLIIKHDSIIIRETIEQYATATAAAAVEKENPQYYYIYFNNGKSNLDEKALVTIQQVADRMQEEQDMYAIIIGYCDNTGSSSLNYALGDKRADNVEDELLAEYGIPEDHIFAAGVGKIVGRRSQGAYAPNRRASVRLVDKATFDRLKAELEGKRTERVEDKQPAVKTVPLTESARPVKKNEYKQRSSETVVSDKQTTLARLARKYYNNTYCWVYIYVANMDKIKNPNALKPGTELTIPELTQQEMRITKDEGLVIYNNARQRR
jgi:outer membrane protein OmpA-like peptidoglycan-associated protein